MRVRTTTGFFVISAIALLILPLPWVTALFVSSLFHELCHYLALKLTCVSVHELRLTAGGAYLHTADMSPLQECVCALAGPVGALSLLLISRWIPRTAICAAVQTVHHLLPIYPLDGGRVVQGLCRYFGLPQTVHHLLEWGVIIMLLLTGIQFCRSVLGTWLLFGAAAIIFRVFREKYLANNDGTGYNSSTNQCEVRL